MKCTDCKFGILADGLDEVEISNSEFGLSSGNFVAGIKVENTINSLQISDNTMSQFSDYGIKAIDNATADVDIHGTVLSSTVAVDDKWGIEVKETIATPVDATIDQNAISELQDSQFHFTH